MIGAMLMKYLFSVCALAVSLGCSNVKPVPDPCAALSCLMQNAADEVQAVCVKNLNNYPRRDRAAIDRTYQYPLTNLDTYWNWVRIGNHGPSPDQWCAYYAQQQIRKTSYAGYGFTSR